MKIDNSTVFKIKYHIIELAIDYNGVGLNREQIVNKLATDFKKLKKYTEKVGTGSIVSITKFFANQKHFEATLIGLAEGNGTIIPAKCLWEPLRKYLQEKFAMLLNMYSNTDISENEFKKLLRKIGRE